MDDFLDQYFSSSSWSVQNVAERSSWISNGPVETNGILPNAFGAYKGDSKNSPISLIPPSHIVENLTSQDTAILGVGDGSNYALGNGLHPGDSVPTKESLDCETNSSLTEMMNGNSKYTGVLLTNPTPNLVNHSSPELVPVIGSCARSPRAQVESGSVGSNDSETSGYQPSLRDPRSLNSIPQLWTPSSFGDSSSLSPLTVQDKLPIFGLQGEYMDSDANMLGNRYLGNDKILQMGNPPASVHLNGHGELNNQCLSSLPTGHHNQLAQMVGLHSQPQLNEGNHGSHYTEQSSVSQLQHTPAMAAGGCNGTAKPRMRARRGQATDPHSIAERLRREKIAERMKNLQELVPNSNKTDKASMLDEIIEYVKFLQLQVKVLSMSRLGAAGAVVPLITDKTEGSNGLLLPQPDDQESEPFDPLAFEQEVVKLMESDVTTAMQFLQSKGLCLMPIALATAMSSRKAPSGPTSMDTKKPISRNGFVHQGNGEVGSKEVGNGCNGNVNQLEEASNLPCDDARELKPNV